MHVRNYTFDGKPIFLLGERGTESHNTLKVQDFYSLRPYYVDKYVKSGIRFEDPEFPASNKSLFYSSQKLKENKNYKWLRPSEICENPRFFVEGFSRFDANQGELGDCWFLAAAANLTLNPKLFKRVVYDENDNGFGDDYCGIFHFCFWRFGKWVDVVIDDRLPTLNGELIFMKSSKQNEFWSALLEKAYAKLHGSYEALESGLTSEAMEDFTGGITERYNLKDSKDNLYSEMIKKMQRGSLMACTLNSNSNEQQTSEGLVRGHAYSITKIQYIDKEISNTKEKIPLLRLRNPWGDDVEWNGAWSDNSPEWKSIKDHVKKEIGFDPKHDGEFWMEFSDFLEYFDWMEICNLSPDPLSGDQESGLKKKWDMIELDGEWAAGISAGGCRDYLDSFHRNPQYIMNLEVPDSDGKCTVLVALMQKNRRSRRNLDLDCFFLEIGFAIYRVTGHHDLTEIPLKNDFFIRKSPDATSEFNFYRSILEEVKLDPALYIIVPSTSEPNQAGEFLIRVFSENKISIKKYDETVRIIDVDTSIKNHFSDIKILIESESPQKQSIEKLFKDIAGSKNEIGSIELMKMLNYSCGKDILDEVTRTVFCNSNDLNLVPSKQMKNSYQKFKRGRSKYHFGNNRSQNQYNIYSYAAKAEIGNLESDFEEFFSKEMCRSMVAMLDVDRSGKLGLEEFKTLVYQIVKWRAVFKLYDKDRNNKLSTFELRDALNSAGYKLNNQVLRSLIYRYGSSDNTLSVNDFILCAVKIETLVEIFKEKDFLNKNVETFTLDEWIALALYS